MLGLTSLLVEAKKRETITPAFLGSVSWDNGKPEFRMGECYKKGSCMSRRKKHNIDLFKVIEMILNTPVIAESSCRGGRLHSITAASREQLRSVFRGGTY